MNLQLSKTPLLLSQSSSHPGTPAAVSVGATPPGSGNGDASVEDPYGPLPSDDGGVGVHFVENEDSSKRAIAMVNKAIGDRQLSKKEELKLRKQLDLLVEEDSDGEKTDVPTRLRFLVLSVCWT